MRLCPGVKAILAHQFPPLDVEDSIGWIIQATHYFKCIEPNLWGVVTGTTRDPPLELCAHARTMILESIPSWIKSGVENNEDLDMLWTTLSHFLGSVGFKARIHEGSRLYVPQMIGSFAYELLDCQGWTQFLNSTYPIYENRVRWFYHLVDFHYKDSDGRTKLNLIDNDREIWFSKRLLMQEFGLKSVGWDSQAGWPDTIGFQYFTDLCAHLNNIDCQSTRKDLYRSVYKRFLTGTNTALLMVIRNVLLPTSLDKQELSSIEVMLLGCLESRTPINLPSLMMDHMRDTVNSSPNVLLPYGGFASHVMKCCWSDIEKGNQYSFTADPTLAPSFDVLPTRLGANYLQGWEVRFGPQELKRKYRAAKDRNEHMECEFVQDMDSSEESG